MNSNKSRILTRLLWCLLIIVLAFVVCYLVYSCRLLNSDEVSLDTFSDSYFMSEDGDYYIYISDDVATLDIITPGLDCEDVAISDYYDNMIFFSIEDEEYIVAVIDESTLFLSNARAYLYLLQ